MPVSLAATVTAALVALSGCELVGASTGETGASGEGTSEAELVSAPTGCIDGASFNPASGLVSIGGWACNPEQTNVQVFLKEARDPDWILYKRFRADDTARADLASLCGASTTMYGWKYDRMRLSPGSYTFRIEVRDRGGVYRRPSWSCATTTTPVTVTEGVRTTAVDNGFMRVRLDRQRGGLIDNIVIGGAHWLLNDQDGRGIGNSGLWMSFNGVNTAVNEGGATSYDPGFAPSVCGGQCLPAGERCGGGGDDAKAGDFGNPYVTTSASAGQWAWSKAHTLNWNAPFWPQWTYADMSTCTGLNGQAPTAPPESTAISGTVAGRGTAIRLDHQVAFTKQNARVVRMKERVRNQTAKAVRSMQLPYADLPGWPFTQQAGFNRFRFTTPNRWYVKTGSPATWTRMPDLTSKSWWGGFIDRSDLKLAGTSGVVLGGPGGAVGMRCLDIGAYYVADLAWTRSLAIFPAWGEATIPSGGNITSTCYYAFSSSATAHVEVGQWLDAAAGYTYSEPATW